MRSHLVGHDSDRRHVGHHRRRHGELATSHRRRVALGEVGLDGGALVYLFVLDEHDYGKTKNKTAKKHVDLKILMA